MIAGGDGAEFPAETGRQPEKPLEPGGHDTEMAAPIQHGKQKKRATPKKAPKQDGKQKKKATPKKASKKKKATPKKAKVPTTPKKFIRKRPAALHETNTDQDDVPCAQGSPDSCDHDLKGDVDDGDPDDRLTTRAQRHVFKRYHQQ